MGTGTATATGAGGRVSGSTQAETPPPTILHSPTERGAIIRHLTASGADRGVDIQSSGLPERYGVDFFWLDATGTKRGVQRKELADLLASLDDGRLTREIAQMNAAVDTPYLLIEGNIQFVSGNLAVRRYDNITYGSFHRRLMSIADRGIQIVFTSEPSRSAAWILAYHQWTMNASHETARHRPKPTNDWGKPTNIDWQIHLLQGLDGVGAKTARAIIETLGRCPLRVDATIEELMSVPGIGRATAHKIIYSINDTIDGG